MRKFFLLFLITPAVRPLSSQARTWTSKSSARPPLERFVELVEDAARVARETGPKATITRTLEGQRAAIATAVELSSELPEPPTAEEVAGFLQAAGSSREALIERVGKWISLNVPPELAPKFLRKLCERLGATYIKLGQFVASSPTLFPAEYVREFEKCLDDAPVVPFSEIRKLVDVDKFEWIDETPMASASIAQVHAAVYQGQDVVVKVRKPGVDLLLKADLGFLDVAGKLLEFLAPDLGRLSLANALEDLRAVMLDELDFTKEATNLEEYAQWLSKTGLSKVATCPLPFPEISTNQVLVMTRLKGGVSVTELSNPDIILLDKGTTPPEVLIANALDVWAASVLTGPFFHADVHAANLLAMPDGRVGFIDFGIVGRIPPAIFDAVARAASSAALRDPKSLAEALRDLGASDADVDVSAFSEDLSKVFDAFDNLEANVVVSKDDTTGAATANIAVNDSQISDLLLALVTAADNYGIKLPREFGLLVKQALYFDKFTKLLAPDLDMAETIKKRQDLPSLRDVTVRDDYPPN